MRLGTKILLLMLLITIGTSLAVAWIVTLKVTRYEQQRANDQISMAIARYVHHLDSAHHQFNQVVDAMLEDPSTRSLLQAADDPSGASARSQLREEIFSRDVQAQLQQSSGDTPAFHVLINLAHEVIVAACTDPSIAGGVTGQATRWPVDEAMSAAPRFVRFYAAAAGKLFLVMGFPLREQLDAPPTHAYFVGFEIDNAWVRRQLLAEAPVAGSTIVPLEAYFILNGEVIARASTEPEDPFAVRFSARTPIRNADRGSSINLTLRARQIKFDLGGNRFVGQAFDLGDAPSAGEFILVSSLDRALLPLRALQRSILLTTIVAAVVALLVCRAIARMISSPIQALVAGTARIGEGRFDSPVQFKRRDELGTLASSLNEMARGLKDREELEKHRIKTEGDLAVARQIQLDVLPKNLPACAGYDLAALSQPAEQTGGDIYDLVSDAPDSPLVILLADASGHGIGAALSVTQVRSMLRIGLRLGATPEDLLAQVNQQLFSDLGEGRFVTAFLGMLDPRQHRLVYLSAGQGPLLHFHARDQRVEWLETSMPPLGVLSETLTDGPGLSNLEPGDLIVLLTDGYYEYQNADRAMFGTEGVARTVRRQCGRSAQDVIDDLVSEIQRFAPGSPQLDDMTAIVIRRR